MSTLRSMETPVLDESYHNHHFTVIHLQSLMHDKDRKLVQWLSIHLLSTVCLPVYRLLIQVGSGSYDLSLLPESQLLSWAMCLCHSIILLLFFDHLNVKFHRIRMFPGPGLDLSMLIFCHHPLNPNLRCHKSVTALFCSAPSFDQLIKKLNFLKIPKQKIYHIPVFIIPSLYSIWLTEHIG